MWASRPFAGLPLQVLFSDETAYNALRHALKSAPAYQPHIPAYVPPAPARKAEPVTAQPSRVTKASRPPVARGHRCAGPNCDKKCHGKAVYCGATCRKRAQRARDKKAGVSR